jgi:hypothetical protein
VHSVMQRPGVILLKLLSNNKPIIEKYLDWSVAVCILVIQRSGVSLKLESNKMLFIKKSNKNSPAPPPLYSVHVDIEGCGSCLLVGRGADMVVLPVVSSLRFGPATSIRPRTW